MRLKLLKEEVCKNFGKYYGKKFYEYGLYTKEELDNISKAHTAKRLEIMNLKEANPQKYAGLSYPKMMLPVPTSKDVNECVHQHKSENVIEVKMKHNNNVQIYVDTKLTEKEPEKAEQPVTTEDAEVIVRRGRPKNG